MKPILFNTEMVQAILAGRKKVTRRAMKDVPCFLARDNDGKLYVEDDFGNEYPAEDRCQYKAGDILYVRETWAVWSIAYGIAPTLRYKADGENLPGIKWRPSIHMPKEAARLFLKVKAVRVERLQDCGNMEAKDEGCSCCSQFAWIWNETVKDKAAYGWEANPWVYVIEFERISKEESYEK